MHSIVRAGIAAAALVATTNGAAQSTHGGDYAASPSAATHLSASDLQAAQTRAPPPYPDEMTLAQSDYVEHCGGCHGIQGNAAPADLPTLRGRVGWFMCTPEGRTYLMRLPNIARSRITDNDELADLLNFMVFGLGGPSTPKNAVPFTGAEVARERLSPFTSVSLIETRARLVTTLIKRCGAPASLRLLYPGQPGPPKRVAAAQ